MSNRDLDPAETDGIEFIEYATLEPESMGRLFRSLGFRAEARHRSKNVTLYRQGDIQFVVNAEPESFSQSFARVHGPSVCAVGFRCKDAGAAHERLCALGARSHHGPVGAMELKIPAIEGIGGSVIYLVDRYGDHTIYDVDFVPFRSDESSDVGLQAVDHLTNNVHRGRMDQWARFYERLFGFQELKYFDIEGQLTGLRSRAMSSPGGKIKIPVNESSDDASQIEEFLEAYRGEGVQHIALETADIYATVETLRSRGVEFMKTPDTYYEEVGARLPEHDEDLERLRELQILIDGGPEWGGGILLQIFTENVIGPIFFEIIQRKGNEGFGEGNFQALFESIEREQIRRGVLTQ